uniref:Ig-like domain-containing protein n=1 Tax=Neolamprologus brichardi TaxID=32507 RepID=A0A3Q4GPJ3_NEOBR
MIVIILLLSFHLNCILVSGNSLIVLNIFKPELKSIRNITGYKLNFEVNELSLLVDICPTGSSYSDKVYQTPADIYTNGEDAKISCSHNISSYNQILWYKQSKKQLELLGYIASQGKNCTLTIKETKLNSSGVYFCAASYHSSAHH